MAWVDDKPHWFSVKVWKTWAVGDAAHDAVEESVYLVRAASTDEAAEEGLRAARRDDNDFLNEEGEQVRIRASHVDYVDDLHVNRWRHGLESSASSTTLRTTEASTPASPSRDAVRERCRFGRPIQRDRATIRECPLTVSDSSRPTGSGRSG